MTGFQSALARAWRLALPRLSNRDSALLSMRALGLTQKEIADQWQVTPQTVSKLEIHARQKARIIIMEIVERG